MFEFDTSMIDLQQTCLHDPSCWSPEYVVANKSACNSALEVENVLQKIPMINYKPLHEFKDMQLVKFHGMIQDKRDPEYFLKVYEVKNTQTGKYELRGGMYRDCSTCLNEEILLESEKNQIGERETLIIISIPGLNEWAQEQSISVNSSDSEARCCQKRSLGNDSFESKRKKEKLLSSAETYEETDPMEIDKYKGNAFSKEFILNFPIPINEGKACIVKLYDDTAFSVNETVEVVGFISLKPLVDAAYNSDGTMTEAEISAHYPPVSIVPRIHAIKIIPLNKKPILSIPEIIVNKAELIRNDLHLLLSELLFGDELAADYLICHLLSSIHKRSEFFCLSPYPLNITHFPLMYKEFPKDLYKFLTLLVRKSHLLELTLDNLDNLTLVPKKDYECNRLTSGVLQLSRNTLLVLDETGLTTGQLTENGRENYNTICNLISTQKLTYDFKFYKLDYDSDIKILILSEAKSFIPCHNQIPLEIKSGSENSYPQITKMTEEYLKNEERLENIRLYLEIIRDKNFSFDDPELTREMQYDLANLRGMKSYDSMNSLMILAKLMALSHGLNTLTIEHWKKAVQMEKNRLDRLTEKKISLTI